MAPGADYSSLATGGTGGAMEGGRPGRNGAYQTSTAGVLTDAGTGEVMIQTLDKPADQDASVGLRYKGGKGAAGKEGGGGGGGGW